MSSDSVRSAPAATKHPLLLAMAGGLAWGLCHGTESRALLAAVALAPLILLAGSRRPFLFGWLHGIVAWSAALPWIVSTLTTYGQLDGWLAGLALLLLAAFLGLYQALFAWLGSRLWRRGDLLSLAALPALWVTIELLRGWFASGFPWNLAAYAWIELPGALPLASWIGAFGVSLLVLVANVGVARAVVTRRWEPAALALLIPATLLAIGGRLAVVPDPPAAQEQALEVRVLQPNIPNRPQFDAAANQEEYRRLLEMSLVLCRPGRLLVWPESAAWPRAWQDDWVLRHDIGKLADEGCSILFNTSFDEGRKTFNSVLLVSPGSKAVGKRDPDAEPVLLVQRADKRHLVPFGEFVPFRNALPFLGKIARTVGEFSPAAGIRLLDAEGVRFGAAVCYEVVFPFEVAALIEAGATALVTVTNDAWYGDSSAPHQHLRAARFRAAENRRWLVRAAITGISAVVRPDGAVERWLPVGSQGALAARIVPRTDRSPFARAPWLLPALCALVAALAIVRARRARGAVDSI